VGIAAATLRQGNEFVILTGMAALVSGSISMGLGEYISSKSEAQYIKNEMKRERAEIKLFPEEEEEEVRQILMKWGLKGETLEGAVNTITSDTQSWIDFLIKSELGLEEPESPLIGGGITFVAFVLGSLITLFPYFIPIGLTSLIISSIISFSMLFIVGGLKTRITGGSFVKSGIEMVIVGLIGFFVSYFVGTWLEP
jgi:VIT1/CCC1 family predicted Fe2+/Mn2+ transporter